MKNNYRFTSIAPNTLGPKITNKKLDKASFENYYNLISKLKILEQLFFTYDLVKEQYDALNSFIDNIHSNKIEFNQVFNLLNKHATLYSILHMLFIHNAKNFVTHFLKTKNSKLYKETCHSQNIRAIRNYTEHCTLPITSNIFNFEVIGNCSNYNLQIVIEKDKLSAFNDLHLSTKKIINTWKNGKIRLDKEIFYAWKELNEYFNKIKKEFILENIDKNLRNQIKDDKNLIQDYCFKNKVTGVINLDHTDMGWNRAYFDDEKIFKNLITIILEL